MDAAQITQTLSTYGYWIILPLMILEGPIITIVAAFMASLGIFNIYAIFAFSILGDILGDIILYGAGRLWGMQFVNRVGRYIGITQKLVLKMEDFFTRHGGKTIFAVKSTTGLCWATFTAAGIVKMPFGRFVWYSFLGGLIWSAFLVFLGFFFGQLYAQIVTYIKYAGWLVFGLAVIVIAGITVYKKRQSEEIFEEDEQAINN